MGALLCDALEGWRGGAMQARAVVKVQSMGLVGLSYAVLSVLVSRSRSSIPQSKKAQSFSNVDKLTPAHF